MAPIGEKLKDVGANIKDALTPGSKKDTDTAYATRGTEQGATGTHGTTGTGAGLGTGAGAYETVKGDTGLGGTERGAGYGTSGGQTTGATGATGYGTTAGETGGAGYGTTGATGATGYGTTAGEAGQTGYGTTAGQTGYGTTAGEAVSGHEKHHHEKHHAAGGLTGAAENVKDRVEGREFFTATEDRPRVRERVEHIRENNPVEKGYVVETKATGAERELHDQRTSEHLGTRERILEGTKEVFGAGESGGAAYGTRSKTGTGTDI